MNYCENCGNKLSPDDRFCQNCGYAVNPALQNQEQPKQIIQTPVPLRQESRNEYTQANTYNEPKKKSSSKVFIVIGIIIVLFIIIVGGGIAGYFYLTQKTDTVVKEMQNGTDRNENKTQDTKNKEIKKEGFNKRERKSGDCGEYPELSERKLSPEELIGVSDKEKKYMKNEIYMRHGYIFTDEDLLIHFAMFECYKPEHMNVNKFLTETEKYNIKLLK